MRHLDTALPTEVVAKAYMSPGSRELAWRRHDLPEALAAIAACGYTILGGEVWWAREPTNGYIGLIPYRDGGTGVWHWETLPRDERSETWQQYCDRTVEESLSAVANLDVEAYAAEDVVPGLWFNVTYVSRRDR